MIYARHFRFPSVIAWPLFLFAIWVPLPLGSNRPVLWLVNLIFLCLFMLASVWSDGTARRVWGGKWLGWIFAALVAWIVLSLVPGLGTIFISDTAARTGLSTLSISPIDTWLSLAQILGFALTFALSYRVAARARALATLVFISLIIMLHTVYSLVLLGIEEQLGFLKTIVAYEGAATGGFVNRNSFATFLAFGMVISMGFFYDQLLNAFQKKWAEFSLPQLLVSVSSLTVILTGLLATESRMGLFVAICGMLTVLIINTVMRKTYRIGVFTILVVIIVSLLVIWFFGGGLLERIIVTDLAFGIRFTAYGEAFSLFLTQPIFGQGAGNFATSFAAFKTNPDLFAAIWDKAHNSYLTLLVELGIVGFVLMISIFVWMLVTQFRKLILGAHIEASIGIGSLVVIAAHSIFDFSIEIYGVTFFLFMILGACTAAPITHERDES